MSYQIFDDWSDPVSRERNELVFENKNKAYGAYTLRNEYEQTLFLSMLAASAIFASTWFILQVAAPQRERNIPPDINLVPDLIVKTVTIPHEVKHETPAQQSSRSAGGTSSATNRPVYHIDDVAQSRSNSDPDPIEVDDPPAANPSPDNGVPIPGSGNGSLPISNAISNTGTNSPISDYAPQMPSYKGGEAALNIFLSSRLKYPAVDLEMGREGTVIIRFVVEADGSVSNAYVVKGVSRTLDAEAIKAVQSMPAWIPGKNGDQSVRVWMAIPVRFSIKKD